MAKNVCDFCLSEGKGLFGRPATLPDGHHICKNCRSIIQSYGLPVKYDLFQTLVTADPNMQDMIMGAYLENNSPDAAIAKFYPYPAIPLHDGEHCINAFKASITVQKSMIPEEDAVTDICSIRKKNISDIYDSSARTNSERVQGMLYETEVALYFMSQKFINCHRIGYIRRSQNDNDRISVITPDHTYTYMVQHADLFFLRERFFQKVNAAKHNKTQHLIYIKGENEVTITPGVYDIPKSLRPGRYKVTAINDIGLHMKDSIGRVKDYYASDEHIDLEEGGILECTGEYELKWIGESEKK